MKKFLPKLILLTFPFSAFCQDNSAEETKPEQKTEAKTEKKESEKPAKIGNFKLAESQRPAPLFSFGQNVISKDQIQFFLFGDAIVGKHKCVSDIIPAILFGVTDDFTIFFNFPYAPSFVDDGHHSNGLEDCFVAFEYAFYNHQTKTYADQATIVGTIFTPTGSIHKNPPTGFGSPAFFVGATYNHMTVDWFVFGSPGAMMTTSEHGTKLGDQFFYQFGFGGNIPSPRNWIFAWMVEVEGQYNKKNRIHGEIDPNSGGNFIFLAPSLFFANDKIAIQFGGGVPVYQNLFGHQNKFDYLLGFQFFCTIN